MRNGASVVRRASKLWIFLTAVFAVGFIATAYLNFVQYQNAQDNTRQLNGTITDLKYQLSLNTAGPSPSPRALPQSSPTPTTSPTPTPAVLSASASPSPSAAPATTAVTNKYVYLHAAASASSRVLADLNAGTTVTLGGAVQNKYQPVSVNGTAGFVAQSYLTY